MSTQRHVWIFLDGRADLFDEDAIFAAVVLEICETRRDVRSAICTWRDHDAVLFEFDAIDGQLDNERRVGHVREGHRALMSRCSRMHRTRNEQPA